jgi:hypothetical protein
VRRETEREARWVTRLTFAGVRVYVLRPWVVLCVYLALRVDLEQGEGGGGGDDACTDKSYCIVKDTLSQLSRKD